MDGFQLHRPKLANWKRAQHWTAGASSATLCCKAQAHIARSWGCLGPPCPKHCWSAHASTRPLASGPETRREGLSRWSRSTCPLLKDQDLGGHDPHRNPVTSEEVATPWGRSRTVTAVVTGGLGTTPPQPGHSLWLGQRLRYDRTPRSRNRRGTRASPVSAPEDQVVWRACLPAYSVSVPSKTYVLEEPPGTVQGDFRCPPTLENCTS